MKRPPTVAIGSIVVKVVSEPGTTVSLAEEGKVGETDVSGRTIRIRHDLNDEQWFEVLLHETMHIVWHLTALPNLLEEHEETVIRSLSPWLAQTVRVVGPRARSG